MDLDSLPDSKRRWGYFHSRPNFLQILNKPFVSVIFLSTGVFIQGIFTGILQIDYPVIEKRFNFQSTQIGAIASCSDISSVLLLLPTSYYGGLKGASKPRWIGTGFLILGTGSLIFFIPELIISKSGATGSEHLTPPLCNLIETVDVCDKSEKKISTVFIIFLFANLVCGIGACPIQALSVAYIEDSVTKARAALYLGIYYFHALLGPALGFIVGSSLLEINNYNLISLQTDNWYQEKLSFEMSSNDSNFVGAWWLGFVICFILLTVTAIPVLGYPVEFPDTPQVRACKKTEAHAKVAKAMSDYNSFKDIPKATLNLFRNPTFTFLILAASCDASVVKTVSLFMPKILQNQFQLDRKSSAMVMGGVTLVGGLAGIIAGSVFLNRFDCSYPQTVKFCIICSGVASLTITALLLHCTEKSIAGINVPYKEKIFVSFKDTVSLLSQCNKNCHCREERYSAICGVDGLTYYSPCYAGCKAYVSSGGLNNFLNCSCIATESEMPDNPVHATSTACSFYCEYLLYFLVILVIGIFFSFAALVPGISATIRCVNASQKAIALGAVYISTRAGMIFSPIVFGGIFDSSCLFWEKKCAESGACILYDNAKFSWELFLVAAFFRILGFIFYFLALKFYKPPEENGNEESTEEPVVVVVERRAEESDYLRNVQRKIEENKRNLISLFR